MFMHSSQDIIIYKYVKTFIHSNNYIYNDTANAKSIYKEQADVKISIIIWTDT